MNVVTKSWIIVTLAIGCHPRTQGLRSLWPAVGNERPWNQPWNDPISSPKIADFRLNCACLPCNAIFLVSTKARNKHGEFEDFLVLGAWWKRTTFKFGFTNNRKKICYAWRETNGNPKDSHCGEKRRRVTSRFRQVVSLPSYLWHSLLISWIILASDRQKLSRLYWLYHLLMV